LLARMPDDTIRHLDRTPITHMCQLVDEARQSVATLPEVHPVLPDPDGQIVDLRLLEVHLPDALHVADQRLAARLASRKFIEPCKPLINPVHSIRMTSRRADLVHIATSSQLHGGVSRTLNLLLVADGFEAISCRISCLDRASVL